MDNKFLDKVCDQIISETRVIDDEVYTPFSPSLTFPHLSPFLSSLPPSLILSSFRSPVLSSFISHCKDVYSLNKEETDYVWEKYKKGLTTLMDKKELV